MGANLYLYVVSYCPNPGVLFPELLDSEFIIKTALDDLRCWISLTGKYQQTDPYQWVSNLCYPSEISFEMTKIREGLEVIKNELDESNDGTRSILDLERIASAPEFRAAGPLPDVILVEAYGTTKPTREMVFSDLSIFGELERGHGAYIVLHKGGEAVEILFAGYALD